MLECKTTRKQTKLNKVSATNDQEVRMNVQTMKVNKCTSSDSLFVFKNAANSLLKSQQDKNFIRLLHARTCQAEDETWGCALLFCKSTKKILNHIQTCVNSTNCTVLECDESKKILTHWDQCKINSCRTCLPVRLAIKKKLVNHPEDYQQIIKEYFLLLFNALQSVSEENRTKGDIRQCKLPKCEKIKRTLVHFFDCKNTTFCTIHYCGLTRQILSHWGDCISHSSCRVCLLINNQQIDNLATNVGIGPTECNSNTIPDVESIKVDNFESQRPSTIDNTIVINGREDRIKTSIVEAQSPALKPVLRQCKVIKVISGNKNNLLQSFQARDAGKEEFIKELYLYQSYLESLLHARICQAKNKTWRCALLLCEKTKIMINHLRSCKNGPKCTTVLCISTKKILGHWNQCKLRNCHICIDIKNVINRNNAVQPPGVITEKKLVHLFHAHNCWEKERNNTGKKRKCIQPYCKAIKNTLSHLSNCNKRIFCPVLNCDLIRRIFVHWNSCIAPNCPACLSVKKQQNNNDTTADSCVANDHFDNNDLNFIFGKENSIEKIVPDAEVNFKIIENNYMDILKQPEHRKLVQQLLIILFHAHKCQTQERLAIDEVSRCTLSHCKTMKNVLNHMTTCKDLKKCTVPYCGSSRQIISHWRQCQISDCSVCSPLRRAIKKIVVNTRAVGQKSSQSEMQPTPVQPEVSSEQQVIVPDVLLPSSPNSAAVVVTGNQPVSTINSNPVATTSAITNIPPLVSMDKLQINDSEQSTILNENQLLHFQLPDCHQLRKVIAMPVYRTKEWQQSVTPDVRNYLVLKIIRAIFPTSDPLVIIDKRMCNLMIYARKVEGYFYEMANSRSEYYHLLAKKIYKIQKDLEEKRQKRRELTDKNEPVINTYVGITLNRQYTESGSVQPEICSEINVKTIDNDDIESSKCITNIKDICHNQTVYINLFQTHLLRLLHAHKCQAEDELWLCALLFCPNMKELLNHIKTCKKNLECTTIYCNESKWIMEHWNQCQTSDCDTCSPVKKVISRKHTHLDSNKCKIVTQEQLIYWYNTFKSLSHDHQTLVRIIESIQDQLNCEQTVV